MFTLKKSMFLLFFFGTVSLSLCDQERDADEEDGGEMKEEEEKRSLFSLIKAGAKFLGKNMLKQGPQYPACKVSKDSENVNWKS
uniref:Preprobrevinin-2SSb n=1 Tax=Glandirana susurra TaxID=1955694 RepID=A0A6S6MER3_9NEOB|nr:preprobrevinin-2SSb [Glandirana susurra]